MAKKNSSPFRVLAVAAAFLAALTGCESMPELTNALSEAGTAVAVGTGTITEEQGASINRTTKAVTKTFEDITPEQEYYIGRSVAATVLNTYPPDENTALNYYLNLLGQTLATYSDMPETFSGYHFIAVNSDEVNAFAAPSGFILISHGLLRCCKNEDELAAVIAHEIGHVQGRHGLKAIRTGRLSAALTTIATEAGKNLGGQELADVTSAFEGSVTDITGTMMNSGYSRSLEYAADQSAVAILARAGYNPRALVSMLNGMKAQLARHSGGFGKTHPTPDDRISRVATAVALSPASISEPPARAQRFANAARFF
jgi:predicted Zn-dependent protease